MKYDYQCMDCDHEQEVEHKITQDPGVICEECGGACKRLISAQAGTGFVLKGKGWFDKGGY